MLTVLLSVLVSISNAAPERVYVLGEIKLIDKGDAQDALLVSDDALVFRCKPFQKERGGYKAVTDGDGYVIGRVQGSSRKIDAMRAARDGKTAYECTRQTLNNKGNLKNY